jgi:hypothetical protein
MNELDATKIMSCRRSARFENQKKGHDLRRRLRHPSSRLGLISPFLPRAFRNGEAGPVSVSCRACRAHPIDDSRNLSQGRRW